MQEKQIKFIIDEWFDPRFNWILLLIHRHVGKSIWNQIGNSLSKKRWLEFNDAEVIQNSEKKKLNFI